MKSNKKLQFILKRTLDVRERTSHYLKFYSGFSKGAERLAHWGIAYCEGILSILNNTEKSNLLLMYPHSIEGINKGLDELGRLLRFFESASDEQTPLVLINHFEDALKKITPQDTLIVRPNNAYQYKYKGLKDDLNEVLTFLPGIFYNVKKDLKLENENIIRIGFPKYDSNNPLVNCLIAHEFGHYIYQDKLKAFAKIIHEFIRTRDDYNEVLRKLKANELEFYDSRAGTYRIEVVVLNWIEESFCDWFAFRFIGPSYFFALLNNLSAQEPFFEVIRLTDIGLQSHENKRDLVKDLNQFFVYPAIKIRLFLLFKHYKKFIFKKTDLAKYPFLSPKSIDIYHEVHIALTKLYSKSCVVKKEELTDKDESIDDRFNNIENIIIKEIKDKLKFDEYKSAFHWLEEFFESELFRRFEKELDEKGIFFSDKKNVPKLWGMLENNIPPNALSLDNYYQKPADWRSILFAAWIHLLIQEYLDSKDLNDKAKEVNRKESNGNSIDIYEYNIKWYQRNKEHEEIINETLGTAFLHSNYLENKKRLSPVFPLKRDGVNNPPKSKYAIEKYLSKDVNDVEEKVVITPLIDSSSQIDKGSFDLRLGHDYILFNRATGVLKINPIEKEEIEKDLHKYQTRIRLRFGEPLYLHPRELILARSLEYISLPNYIAGDVVGRSSLGRLGPIIATAPLIQPGFKGTVTLEIVNLGNIPVVLYPCLRVAQLVLKFIDSDNNGKKRGNDKNGKISFAD